MVARNFSENFSILHPSVNMEGGKEIAMEFPFFNYLVFLMNEFFGFTHWYGRILNLIVTSVGLIFFFKILEKTLSRQTAFYATIILGVSVFFSFGRKIMPDTFSVSLVLIGLYSGFLYVKELKPFKELFWFVLTIVFLSLGTLSKLPSCALFGFFLFPLISNPASNKKRLGLILAIFLSLSIVFWWYAVWNSKLESEGAIRIIFPLTLREGFISTMNHLSGVLEKFYFSALSSYIAFLFFLAGIIYAFLRKEKRILLIFAISFLAFFVFVLKTGSFFYFHNYYIIPIAPIMSLVAGYGIQQIKITGIRQIAIILLVGEAILNQQHDFRIRHDMEYKTGLENIVDRYSVHTEKIVINTGPSLQQLYFANRKGWILDAPKSISLAHLDSISQKQYALVVLDNQYPAKVDTSEFTTLFIDEHYTLLQPRRKMISPEKHEEQPD
jgi:hypothetical protein